jgi:glycosyltransferase involved in cell wall biosynthesis
LVTVVTSSIGRPELRQCIESVRAQTYPVNHHVYVNGPGFHASARRILSDYHDVTAFYLPEDTGDIGAGPSMSGVFSAAPFLTNSEWILYLDDDNWFEPNHVESLVNLATAHNLSWAYSLRRLVSADGTPICDDDWCSLGQWPVYRTGDYVVDNSCYLVRRDLAMRCALAWQAIPMIQDRCYLMALKESGKRYGCTGLSTVNYRVGTGTAEDRPDIYLSQAKDLREAYPDGFPWRTPQVFG